MKLRVKHIQLGVGVDGLGSKMSLAEGRSTELTLTDESGHGVIAHSKAHGRYVFIPMANIRGIEMYPPEAEPKADKKPKAKSE